MSGWLSSGLYGWPFVATAFGLARIVAPRSRPSSSAVERLPYTQVSLVRTRHRASLKPQSMAGVWVELQPRSGM
jgi:hypothetical protein